ncbi:MAG TPA: MerR family transcriptional regulator [Acidimicrobiales bacterium]|nr:MerR family transcriptional regulator [Acidimicrobiales bacterium]
MERRQREGAAYGGSSGGEGYRGPQVCNIVGITYRQLDYWARTDLLRPSVSDARGSGTQRVYSYTDLLQLKVIKQLLDAGVSLRSTRKAIECLRASGEDVASASLVIADDRSVLAHSGEELFDLLRGGQGVLSIVLGMEKIVSEVNAAITLLTGSAGRPQRTGADPDRQEDEAARTAGQPGEQAGAPLMAAAEGRAAGRL